MVDWRGRLYPFDDVVEINQEPRYEVLRKSLGVHGQAVNDNTPGVRMIRWLYGPTWPGRVSGPPGEQKRWAPLRDVETASRLWTMSEELTGVTVA